MFSYVHGAEESSYYPRPIELTMERPTTEPNRKSFKRRCVRSEVVENMRQAGVTVRRKYKKELSRLAAKSRMAAAQLGALGGVEWSQEYQVASLCKEAAWGLLTLPKQVENTRNLSGFARLAIK